MKKTIFSLLFIFLVSCTSNTIYKKPKDLIPKDTMILLLTDMYIASSARFTKNKRLERDINYMPLVYENYKIDSLRFKKSNIYYTSKLEVYEEILQKVKNNLQSKIDTNYTKNSIIEMKGKEILRPAELVK
ncbi:MAG: DUF4296 domain-containing protein [Tenacibaculum sp.]|nr:DUF4296 domain-containing protein [Tenacibaculum sp.]